MIKYRTCTGATRWQALEVTYETAFAIGWLEADSKGIVREQTALKTTSHWAWHDTPQQAKDWLLRDAKTEVRRCDVLAEMAQERLIEIQGLETK